MVTWSGLPVDDKVLPDYNLDGFSKQLDDEKEKHIRGSLPPKGKCELCVNHRCNCTVPIRIKRTHQRTNVQA